VIDVPGLAKRVSPEELVDVACGLCGSGRRELRFADGPFSVVRCSACGLTYVTPRLAPGALIQEVYDEGYWSSSAAKDRGYSDYRSDAPLYLKTYRKRLSVVRRHFPKPARVLDVGCAAGYFLAVMAEAGWQVTGVEPSDAIRAQAVERLGAERVHGGLLQDVPLEPGSFDLVTFWDVIEHVPDPVAVLAHARTLLAPGGKLLIETQNVDSRAAKLLGKAWQHYKHAEHIYHFNPHTIADLLGRAGYRILENSPRLGGKYVSLGFVAERAARLHPAISWLLSPLKLVAGTSLYVNLFDEMIVIAEPANA
jgi:SAM-dependent methyltransferase